MYVVVRLPNGRTLQESVDTNDDKRSVRFDLRSPHEWLQWVAPFQSLDHLRDGSETDPFSRRRIGRVWMTLWSLNDGRWQSKPLEVASRDADPNGMQQVTIDVPNNPHLLQVGGDEVGWRLVTLPPDQTVRVALTRSPRRGGDSIDITIARKQADNEIILSYLREGAISEANTLAETLDIANQLLKDKIEDPISAAAAGYVLLRNNKLTERQAWVRNLMDWFPALADGAIIAAALTARLDGTAEKTIRDYIKTALDRGLPIFSIGADMLLQTMAAVHGGDDEKKGFHQSYLALQAYVRAAVPVGPYFAFEGFSPAEPTWVSVFGPQDNPGFGLEADGSTPRGQLVYSRPTSIRGRYGHTVVQLPRAPVGTSAESAMTRAIASQPALLPSSDAPAVEIRRVRGRQLSGRLLLSETTFLSHLSAPATNPVLGLGDRDGGPHSKPRRAASKETRDQVPTAAGSSPQRQSERYWREQRETNALTMFDE
ncbi:hypothetical protein [Neorhizobium sp. SHOUNA12A]|uniref:hypothetical protein n=1 Tax=Neorhizobium sp. SHOUNA12A TaxID=2908923 RepID=UPI001FF39564|nr:hypothetical protein [Neorhizobium sp. SHOUNA12A]